MDPNIFANVALPAPKLGWLFVLSCIVCCESDFKFRGLRHQKYITPAVLLQATVAADGNTLRCNANGGQLQPNI